MDNEDSLALPRPLSQLLSTGIYETSDPSNPLSPPPSYDITLICHSHWLVVFLDVTRLCGLESSLLV